MKATMDQYQKAFKNLQAGRKTEPEWLRNLREKAAVVFAEQGFPTVRDEVWRYTDLTPLREISFEISGAQSEVQVEGLSAGVQVLSMTEALKAFPEVLEKHFGQNSGYDKDPFVALNTAFLNGGVFVRIPDGVVLKEPVRITYVAESGPERSLVNPRTFVLMGKGSRAALVEIYKASGESSYFTNSVSEFILGEGAALEHAKVQQEGLGAFHVASNRVVQARGSRFLSLSVSVGSRLMRHGCRVELAGEETECTLNGLSLTEKDQHHDYQTFIDHAKPSGKSRQLFKGLLAGNSRGVFTGKVLVRKDAQHTDAAQTNKNILLSDEAKVDARPQLEILADDVKCSHGAAVGQLAEDAIFYLKSRGIDEAKAGRMLAQGFAQDVIDVSVTGPLKEEILRILNDKLEKLFD
ncbi:MAG TPA: Fe-S cluster assembly protein SufD [Candidatus Omnitrophota bacterium]|nr:Fe-S cluster assembly protein SufD [Candidatus Omnitrophota bacterium]HPS36845.1 Fe-S cluster assembly protein SufD [Candidatus Omnitrophota bacterium]